MARVMVSVPTLEGYIREEADLSLRNLDPCGHELVHRNVKGWGIGYARNLMALDALDSGCEYLLMVDSDVVVPEDAIGRLLVGLDVCMGWYPRGTDPSMTNVIKTMSGYKESYSVDEVSSSNADYIEVGGNGLGCALVKTSVFRRIPHPWFKFEDFPGGSALGEDYWFFQRCKDAGIRAYVDPHVRCGHVRSVVA